jgi:PAS domain S-box-containing protein
VPVDIATRKIMLNNADQVIGVFRDITKRKLIERELHETERRFYSLLENVNLISVMLNTSGEILFCNQYLLDLTGWKMEEVLRKSWFDLFVPDPSIKTVFDLAIKGETIPSHIENEIKTREGNTRLIAWNNVIIRNGEGRVTGTASIGEDITERTKAVEALRRYELLSKHARDIIFFIDMDGRIIEANEAAEKIYGYSRQEFLSLTVADLRPAGTRDDMSVQMATAYEQGLLFETEHRRKDRTTLPVEVSSIGVNIGGRRLLLSIVRDITQRKRAEEALRASERKFRQVFEKTAFGMAVTDRNRRIHDCNPAFLRMLGYSREELLSKTIADISVPEDDEENVRLLRSALENKQPHFSMEKRYIRKDGSVMPGKLTVSLVHGDAAEEATMIGIVEDITERQKMEQELLKLQKLESIGVLAGGIAHDFNNLLMGILGNIALSRMQVRPDSKAAQLLGAAEDACAQAKELSYRLLTFSKGGEPFKRPLSLPRLLRDAAALPLSGSKVSAEFSFPEDLPFVELDEEQIKQVIVNVVTNAREAMPDGGIVRITAEMVTIKGAGTLSRKPGHYIKIGIVDQGVGIPPENLAKIFDPYFSTKEFSSQRGRGLGLAICHSIMLKHEGAITATSVVGKGTTIEIFIPAAGPTPVVSGVSPVAAISPATKKRVLVMDDDERVRTVVKNILEHLAYEATCAAEGGEAVALYRGAKEAGRPFDLVFLDLSVPKGVGGIDALRRLREIDPAVRAIVSSGYANDPIIKNFRFHGFVGAIAKPYNVQQLIEILRDTIKPA